MPRKLSKPNNTLRSSSQPPPTSRRRSSSQGPRPNISGGAPLPAWLDDDSQPLPQLIVLDLDYTLWPFYSDIHIATPIRAVPSSNHATISDRNGETFALYPDVPHILHLLPQAGIKLGVASKSPVGDLCRDVLKHLRLPPAAGPQQPTDGYESASKTSRWGSSGKGRKTIEVFEAGLEIYEGTKLRHFEAISRRTGVPFEEMLFFDDERPNFEVERLGVTMHLVSNGLTWTELERGIQKWRAKRSVA
ncbi:acid phosphatase-domain-containing protein [Podospora appendiculata]|uniref:Acid phosphatase-domain-containing protein n=1 Tax=Podospora appendiculata TaxID=314037 RepID=A0AAE0X8R2_9PEZI|nr:acid phosphatase-domain-containing protein [Podospora appendiculata]